MVSAMGISHRYCPLGIRPFTLQVNGSLRSGEQGASVAVPKPKRSAAMAAGLLLWIWPSLGRTADPPCASLILDTPADLDASWTDAVADLRVVLTRELTPAECASLQLAISRSPSGGIIVEAQTRDGRHALRAVAYPRALLPVVLGLIASDAPEAPSQRPLAQEATPDPHETPDFSPPPGTSVANNHRVGLSVGFSTGIRAGLPTDVVMADAEMRADVSVQGWIILASVRYVPIAAAPGLTPDGDAYVETGLGLGIGRQAKWGRHSLDLTATPSLVFVTMETDSPTEKEAGLTQFRINAAARYGYALRKGWRFTVTLDSEVAPSSLVRPEYPDPALRPVPAWTAGLRLGATASLF
jgi:hypothetical protein